jgi:hypothetical protein
LTSVRKYKQIPPTVQALAALEVELETEGYSLDDAGLILEFDETVYDVTPCDVISFARLGIDGIHFGLLTDFGMVTDLEKAFVVCISPMVFDIPAKLVARNLQEFVRLLCTVKSADAISNFVYMSRKDQYLNYMDKVKKEAAEHDEYTVRNHHVINKIHAKMGCNVIEDVYDYVEKQVAAERKRQTILPTLDGLGIRAITEATTNHTMYRLEKEAELDLREVRSFFQKATLESKLAFIRDAQFTYLIAENSELRHLVVGEMCKLGLHDEVERLQRNDLL